MDPCCRAPCCCCSLNWTHRVFRENTGGKNPDRQQERQRLAHAWGRALPGLPTPTVRVAIWHSQARTRTLSLLVLLLFVLEPLRSKGFSKASWRSWVVETAKIKTVRFFSGFIFFRRLNRFAGRPGLVGIVAVVSHRPHRFVGVMCALLCTDTKTRCTAVQTVCYVRDNASCLHDETTTMTVGYNDLAKDSGTSAAMCGQPWS